MGSVYSLCFTQLPSYGQTASPLWALLFSSVQSDNDDDATLETVVRTELGAPEGCLTHGTLGVDSTDCKALFLST